MLIAPSALALLPLASVLGAAATVAMGLTPIAQVVVTAFDMERATLYQCFCHFAAGTGVDLLHCGSGYLHICAAFFLRESFFVDEPQGFVLIH